MKRKFIFLKLFKWKKRKFNKNTLNTLTAILTGQSFFFFFFFLNKIKKKSIKGFQIYFIWRKKKKKKKKKKNKLFSFFPALKPHLKCLSGFFFDRLIPFIQKNYFLTTLTYNRSISFIQFLILNTSNIKLCFFFVYFLFILLLLLFFLSLHKFSFQ